MRGQIVSTMYNNKWLLALQSRQVCTPQDSNNEFIIQKLNALVVVDFRFTSPFLHV